MYPSLGGQHVFITGGGSGIGASIVEAFANEGSLVTFVDIDINASTALANRFDNVTFEYLRHPKHRNIAVSNRKKH